MTKTIKLTILGMLALCATSAYAQLNSVYFGKSGSELNDSSKVKLDRFFKAHLSTNTPEVVVKGYSDTTGTSKINLKLSKQRVEAVKEYLYNKSYPAHRIKLEYFGEAEAQEESLWKNRRVDLFVNPEFDVYDYLADFGKKAQTFEIQHAKDTVIYGQEGTAIFIPAACFVTKEGKAVTNIAVSLTEFYQPEDILTSNLSTVTDSGDILQTSGMIHLEATAGGEKCAIAQSASISVGFPNVKDPKNNNLYQGEVNQGQVIWESGNTGESIEYGVAISGSGHLSLSYVVSGITTFDKYLSKNVVFPLDALQAGVCGLYSARFNIDSKGQIRNVTQVGEGLHPSVDAHILQVLEAAPKLTPAFKKEKKALKEYWTAVFIFSSDQCTTGSRTYSIKRQDQLPRKWLVKNPPTDYLDGVDITDMNNISRAVYSTTQLGWLNVDQLKRLPGPKVNMELAVQPAYNVDFKIILEDYRSIVAGKQRKNSFVFPKMPQGQEGVIIGLKYDNDKIYLAKSEIITDEVTIDGIEFKEVTALQLKAELKALQ